jgi:hypothetical protein
MRVESIGAGLCAAPAAVKAETLSLLEPYYDSSAIMIPHVTKSAGHLSTVWRRRLRVVSLAGL